MSDTKLNWYWYSFSFEGKNQGCCNVEAETADKGLQLTIEYGCHPKHDDIECIQIEKAELTPNILFTPEQLAKLGFDRITYDSMPCPNCSAELKLSPDEPYKGQEIQCENCYESFIRLGQFSLRFKPNN